MRREVAETVNELHLCPLCMYCHEDWNSVVEHLETTHTDEEAFDDLGLDPTWFGPPGELRVVEVHED